MGTILPVDCSSDSGPALGYILDLSSDSSLGCRCVCPACGCLQSPASISTFFEARVVTWLSFLPQQGMFSYVGLTSLVLVEGSIFLPGHGATTCNPSLSGRLKPGRLSILGLPEQHCKSLFLNKTKIRKKKTNKIPPKVPPFQSVPDSLYFPILKTTQPKRRGCPH